MLKGNDIIGKPIITYDTGKQIEKVQDLIFDQSSNFLLGFLVSDNGWFSSAKVIPLEDIHAIGPDAVIAKWKLGIVPARKVPEIKKILERNNVLKGTKLMTTDGRNLGTMVDLYFDERTGKIEGYEVTGGLFADATSGRSFVPAPQTLKIGIDVAFVPPETAEMMQEQVNDIQNKNSPDTPPRTQRSPRKAGRTSDKDALATSRRIVIYSQETEDGAIQTAGDRLIQTPKIAVDRLHEAPSSDRITKDENLFLIEGQAPATTSLTDTFIDQGEQKAFVVGKIVDRTVITPDGTPLVVQGQVVTFTDAEAAVRWGILNQLYLAAGGNVQDRSGQKLQDAPQIAIAQPLEVTQTTTEKVQLTKDKADDKLEETPSIPTVEQTKGRRLQRSVRTQEGFLIAATGQIVNDRVIDRAKTYHQEQELMAAVGINVGEAVPSNKNDLLTTTQLQTAVHSADENLLDGAIPGKQEASGLWEPIKKTVSRLQKRNHKAIEAQRLKKALGRPVNRVLLDSQDNVILNIGEVITHQAIEKARQAGVLDILLESVDGRNRAVSPEAGRAPLPGWRQ